MERRKVGSGFLVRKITEAGSQNFVSDDEQNICDRVLVGGQRILITIYL